MLIVPPSCSPSPPLPPPPGLALSSLLQAATTSIVTTNGATNRNLRIRFLHLICARLYAARPWFLTGWGSHRAPPPARLGLSSRLGRSAHECLLGIGIEDVQ